MTGEVLTEEEALTLYRGWSNLQPHQLPRAKERLRAYMDARKAAGEPLWPQMEANWNRAQMERDESLWLNEDTNPTVRQIDFMAGVTGRAPFDIASEPNRYRRAVAAYLGSQKDGESPEAFDALVKNHITRRRDARLLKWGNGKDDEASEAENQLSMARFAGEAARINKDAVQAFQEWQRAVSGKPGYAALQQEGEGLFTEFQQRHVEASDYWRDLEKRADSIIAELSLETENDSPFVLGDKALPHLDGLTRPQRQMVMALVSERAKGSDKGFAKQSGEAVGRVFSRLIEAQADAVSRQALDALTFSEGQEVLARFADQPAELVTRQAAGSVAAAGAGIFGDTSGMAGVDPEELFGERVTLTKAQADAANAEVARRREAMAVVSDLRDAARGAVDPVRGSNFVTKWGWYPFLNVAGSLGSFAMPGGWAANLGAYINDEQNRLESIGVDRSTAAAQAVTVGSAQALMDKLQLKFLGRMTALRGVTSRLAAPAATTAGFFGRRVPAAVGGAAVQTGIEAGQEALPLAVQMTLDALGVDEPDVSWADIGREAWAATEESFFGMLPLMLLGAGVGARRDFRSMRSLVADRGALRAMGFDEAQADRIAGAGNEEAMISALRAEWPARTPVYTAAATPGEAAADAVLQSESAPVSAKTAAAQLKAEVEESRAFSARMDAVLMENAGIQSVRRSDAGWTVHGMDGSSMTLESPGEVRAALLQMAHARDREAAQEIIDEVDALAAANVQRGEGTEVAFTGETRRAVREGDKVSVTRGRGGQQSVLEVNPESLSRLRGEMTALGLSDAVIRGSNWLQEDAGRIVRHYELNLGSDVSTVVHERVESLFKSAAATPAEAWAAANQLAALPQFDPGRITDAGMRRMAESLRRIALEDESVTEDERRETLVELVVADYLGRWKDGTKFAPGTLRDAVRRAEAGAKGATRRALEAFSRWLAMVGRYFGALFGTVRAIREARASGDLKPGEAWDTFVDKLLGMDGQRAHEAAVIKEVEAQTGESYSLGMSNAPGAAQQDSTPPGGLTEAERGKLLADAQADRTKRENRWLENSDIPERLTPDEARDRLSDAGNDNPTAAEIAALVDESIEQEKDARESELREGRGTIDKMVAQKLAEQTLVALGFRMEGVSRKSEATYWTHPNGTERIRVSDHEAVYQSSADAFQVQIDERSPDEWVVDEVLSAVERLRAYERKHGSPVSETAAVTNPSARSGAGNAGLDTGAPRVSPQPATAVNEQSAAPADGAESFSLGSVNVLEQIAAAQEARAAARGPKAKLEMHADMARTLSGMARAARMNEETERVLALGEIEAERRRLQQRLEDEYILDVYRGPVGAALGEEENTEIKSHPFLSKIIEPGTRGMVQGRFLSPAKARKAGRALEGEYDGAREWGLPGWLFKGEMTPDLMSDELGFDRVDDMWSEIASALHSLDKAKERLRKAQEQIAEAKVRARDDARAWAGMERAKLAASDKRDAKRALVALDAMMLHAPAEVRVKVGGFARMNELTTNAQREKYFRERLEALDREMDAYLKKQYLKEVRELFVKSRARRVSGEKDKGRLGVNAYTWIETAEAASKLGTQALAQREAWISTRLYPKDESERLTPEEIAEVNRAWDLGTGEDAALLALEQEQAILELFGGLSKKDSGELESALLTLRETVDRGRMQWEGALRDRRDRRAGRRAGLKIDSGNDGSATARAAKTKELRGAKGRVSAFFNLGASMEQLLGDFFGRESDTHLWAEETILNARLAAEAAFIDSQGRLSELLKRLWPRSKSWQRMKQLERLSTERPVKDAPEGTPELSELQAVHLTMLWSDVESRAWLREHGFGEDTQEKLEAHLSLEAREIRAFLVEEYDRQYDRLNDVYRRLHGVNMPRVRNYAPRMVLHGGDTVTLDPLAGGGMSSRGVFAGFTKRRRPDLTAAPVLADALQAFMQNQRVVTHFLGWAEASGDLRAVFSTSETKPFIVAAAGDQGARALHERLTDLEAGGYKEALAMGYWRGFMRALADNALVGKLGPLLKQASAVYGSAVELGWGSYLRSAGRLMRGEAAATVQQVAALPVMKTRLHNLRPETMQAASGTGPAWMTRQIRRLGLDTTKLDVGLTWLRNRLGALDAVLTLRGAAIAYDSHWLDGKEQKMSDAAAHEYAARETQRTIARTAQPAAVADRSHYENRAGTFGRLMFAFQSMNRQMFFATWAALRDGGISDARARRMLGTWWVMTGIITQAIGAGVRDMFSDEDEDEDWKLGDFIRAATLGPLTGALYLGPLVDVVGSWTGGFERRTEVSPAGAVSDFTKEAIEAFRSGEEMEAKEWEKMARAAGLFGQAAGGGWWSSLNVLANLWKQGAGFGDNLFTSEEEAMEADAARQRKAEKEAREAEADALTDEEEEEARRVREENRRKRLQREAAKWRARE